MPMFKLLASYTGPRAEKADNRVVNLASSILLVISIKVILTSNLQTKASLVNSSLREIVNFSQSNSLSPFKGDVPAIVLYKFISYNSLYKVIQSLGTKHYYIPIFITT